jgi:thiol:disulfide interchange protein DsbC
MSACVPAGNPSPEEMFKKSFPEKQFESITATPIKGIYEVYTGNQLYYFMPESKVLIYGNIVSKDGRSLTRESFNKKVAGKMAQLPLENALKIGNGKKVVVEFMDPDCHFCREAFKFLSQREDVTVYIFFYPLSQVSEKKIRYILCAADQVKAYYEVMSGKHDNNSKLNVCPDKKVDETLKLYKELAANIGLRSTPFFYIKGQVIDGFDVPVLEKLLKD